jgi:hypothetical protein
MDNIFKICNKCNNEKPISDFYIRKNKKLEIRYINKCKSCILQERKIYFSENKGFISQKRKERYIENKEEINKKRRFKYSNDEKLKIKNSKQNKKYRLKNKDKI